MATDSIPTSGPPLEAFSLVDSPILENGAPRSFVNRRRAGSSRRLLALSDRLTYKERFLRGVSIIRQRILSTYNALTVLQRILAAITLLVISVLCILFVIYSHRIFNFLGPVAEEWKALPGGWVILWLIIFICAFPPIIGYSTALSISGFVYGFPNGWFISASANVVGSLASFVACRTVLSGYVRRRVGGDTRFNALALTLKHDGLKILVMIRLCPLPYSFSNGGMSTLPTVSPLMFTLATVLATPKLLIHVFIGSRLKDLILHGEKMDIVTKVVNYTSIIGGGLLGASLGYYIYRRTMTRAEELQREEIQGLTDFSGDDRNNYFEQGNALLPDPDDLAAGMDDDDISLWDNEDEGYRDSTDNERLDKRALMDEEAVAGM
jgi:uncharacterized membrane protein YdjX (TVP38/TMEM64 family)